MTPGGQEKLAADSRHAGPTGPASPLAKTADATRTRNRPDPAPRCFRIVRFYHPRLERRPRTLKNRLTETEAQAHCARPDTCREGVYFDGYDYMKGTRP